MVIITARELFPAKELYNYINENDGNVTSGWVFLNPHPIHSAQGTPVHIYGNKTISEELAGIRVKVSPHSFIQTNSLGCRLIYEIVRDYLQPQSDELIVDLYSGIGSIGLFLAPYVKQVIGVENVEQAVDDARLNARENRVENISFEKEDVRKWLYRATSHQMKIQAVVIDPPRAGLTKKVIARLKLLSPKRIVF